MKVNQVTKNVFINGEGYHFKWVRGMNRMLKKIVIMTLLLFSIMTVTDAQSNNSISTAYLPTSPIAGSNITFYSTIMGNNVSQVILWIEECSSSMCSFPKEIDMVKTDEGNYTATYTLRDDTIYFHYKIVAQIDGEQVESTMYNITVVNQGGSNDNSGNTNNTPGFEIIEVLVVLSLFMALLIRRR